MKYRKKPIVIDAEQFDPNYPPYPSGVEKYTAKYVEHVSGASSEFFAWRIKTLEGWHEVTPGDWIITGIKGEKYPCKPDIFAETYEKTEK